MSAGRENRTPGRGADAITTGHTAQDGFNRTGRQADPLHRGIEFSRGVDRLATAFHASDQMCWVLRWEEGDHVRRVRRIARQIVNLQALCNQDLVIRRLRRGTIRPDRKSVV